MSEHKPLGFVKDSENWYDVTNSYGSMIGSITRIAGAGRDGVSTHAFTYNGFSSERLLEIAIKIEELNNVTEAHTDRASEEQSQSETQEEAKGRG